ncbi:hypothetical protein [Enterobacter sp.]|uniref:T6SS immunity protein Tli3 family protein n=1 Tax=Enterobacter sp. TaxID=42895 RepID=UPI0031D780D0
MKGICLIILMIFTSGCQSKKPPTQVVYRFDDHRYLELKGWNCEGELWYIDTVRGIRSQPASQFYRIFTHKYVHPSERYIAVASWDYITGAFLVSKDYGQSWHVASMSPGPNEPDGMNAPEYDKVISFTVVNDQGFLETKNGLYTSSKPFDDPRVQPGGPGIKYVIEGDEYHITPQFPGSAWGDSYMTKKGLKEDTLQYHVEWQGLPDKVPEVKNYKGWDHMRCDYDAGK